MFEIGSSLREARERKNLQLPEVERATRIRTKYLQALEDERFDILPGAAYAKGFLRTYADYLDLEPQPFIDEYNSRFALDEEPEAALPVRVRRPRRLLDARLVAIPIAIAVGLSVWRLTSTAEHHHTGSSPPTPHVRVSTTARRPTAPKLQPPRTAHIALVAARGPCWLLVRIGSETGKRIYARTLEQGQTVRFVAGRLWMRIGAPWNVDATLNGKRAQLPTTISNVLVTPGALRTISS